MAFTKINAAGIGTTETVTVDGLTVINDGSFGGNLTVGGVLTYEDVTNVDSVGLITARNGIVVGSGITLSKDGDIFFTGIMTGNGSGLTNLATDLVNDTSPQLGGTLDVNGQYISFPDSNGTTNQARFGTGDDLKIYHQSNSSYIINATGNLNIGSNNAVRILGGSDVAESMAVFTDNGAVELYYDNSKKLETTSSGVTLVDGLLLDNATNAGRDVQWQPASDRLAFLDNTKATFGNELDLQIYHDSNNSAINHNGNGDFYIQSNNNIYIRNIGGDNYISAIEDGAVELYHNNSKKLFTLSDGVEVTGDLYLMDDDYLKLGNGSDLKIYHNGSHSYIDNDTGTLYLQTATNISLMTNNNEDAISCIANGAVNLYHDNALRLQTNSSGVSILNSGGVPALSVSAAGANRADVRILASGTGEAYLWMDAANGDLSGADYTYFQHRNSDLALLMSNYGGDVFINCRGGSLGSGTLDTAFKANAEGSVELYNNGSKKFQTTSDGFETGSSFATDGSVSGVRCTAGSLIQTSENSTAFRYAARFYNPNGQVGYISTQNNGTNYNTSGSDRALKKNFENWNEDVLSLFKNINPQKFNFITDEEGAEKSKGFIAQDMVSSFPEAYTKGAEEDSKYFFNPSGMVVYLMKALQEATVKIEALETKVAALEG